MTQQLVSDPRQQPTYPVDTHDYILEHYRALRERFKSQGDRLWQRFNFFLTVEVAFAGAFLWSGKTAAHADLQTLGPLLGLILSLFWFVIAAQDLWFYEDARVKLKDFMSRCILPAIPSWTGKGVTFIVPTFKKPICFKIPKTGVTTLAPIASLLFVAFWLFVLWHG